MDTDYVFMTRPYWLELSIPQSVVREKYIEYFGSENIEISTRKEAVDYMLKITGKIQEKMVTQLKGEKACCLLKDLYKILDEAFHFYLKQKEARKKLIELNVQDSTIMDVFEDICILLRDRASQAFMVFHIFKWRYVLFKCKRQSYRCN